MKPFLIATCALLLSACASGPQTSVNYTYNEIRIVNNTAQPVSGLRLSQPVSGLEIDCGDITPLGQCQQFFGRRPYQPGPYQLDWAVADGPRQTTQVDVNIAGYNAHGIPLYLEIGIGENAALTARFVQKTPR